MSGSPDSASRAIHIADLIATERTEPEFWSFLSLDDVREVNAALTRRGWAGSPVRREQAKKHSKSAEDRRHDRIARLEARIQVLQEQIASATNRLRAAELELQLERGGD